MATVQIINPVDSPAISDRSLFRVYWRRDWADAWALASYLYPLSVTRAIAPEISSAELRLDYGEIKREDSHEFGTAEPGLFEDYFIKIERLLGSASDVLFQGVVPAEHFSMHGATTDPSGVQTLTAVGLEYLLDRVAIRGAHCKGAAGTVEIGWTPVVNERYEKGMTTAGNRSSAVNADGVYEFANDGDAWSHLDVANYLIQYHSPSNVTFALAGQHALLDRMQSVLRLEGLTLRQALNRLIDRRRGLGWCVVPGTLRLCLTCGKLEGACTCVCPTCGLLEGECLCDPSPADWRGPTVDIQVFSLFGDKFSAHDLTIDANANQFDWQLDDAIDVSEALVTVSTASRYDRIVVQGERVKSCFSLSHADGTLEAGWTAAEETDYKAGDAFDNTDPVKNDAERATDKLERVYQVFRIPAAWNWEVADGIGGIPPSVDPENAAPTVRLDGSLDTATTADYWNVARPLLRFIPVEKEAAAAGAEPEYLSPLVLVVDGSGNFRQVENLSAIDLDPGYVRMLDREAGLHVKMVIGHVLGLNHFSVPPDAVTNKDPVWDWQGMIATVCAETDARFEVTVEMPSYAGAGSPRTLVIAVEGAECWYVVPQTVTGVEDGALIRHAGGVVRDDSARLKQIAALAAAWYGQRRAAVRLGLRAIRTAFVPGSYVHTVSSSWQREEVGSVVSRVSYDCVDQKTTVETAYSELDAATTVEGVLAERAKTQARQIDDLARQTGRTRRDAGNVPARFCVKRVSADRGWFLGGCENVLIPGMVSVTIDRVTLAATMADASDRSDLSLARAGLAAVQNDRGCWLAGGNHTRPAIPETGGDPADADDRIDHLNFATDKTDAIDRCNLSAAREALAGVENDTHGWLTGGYDVGGNSNRVDRITFADDEIDALDRCDLSLARYGLAGVQNSTHGWLGGGKTGPFVRSDRVDRIEFADDTANALDRCNLSVARGFPGAVQTGDYGWFAGGINPGDSLRIDRLEYANDLIDALDRCNLSGPRQALAGVQNARWGCFGGGATGFWGTTDVVDRITLADDTVDAIDQCDLSIARSLLAAASGRN